jgi:tripartite-type tricarboxylate transporter receptor subunit TctC
MHRRQALTAIAAGWGVLAGTAQAQNFPSRPLRLIVGYTAGGAVDIGEMLAATTEQPTAMLSSEKNRYEKLIREARIQPD